MSKIEKTAPIILFVYNRPEHTRRALEALSSCEFAGESRLFIYSDGAKGQNDIDEVKMVREIIHKEWDFKGIEIVEREKNTGLAANIIDGVTTIVNRFGRVIVLEDDLIVSKYFLQFMNEALEMYADEPGVGHIQAYDFTGDTTLPDTFLIKWTGSWGWATWARAWKMFNPDGKALLNELRQRKLTREFDFNGNYRFTRMLRRQVEGKNNSWAIRWNASLFLKDILSLNVGRSLVQNIGFDGTGTHSGDVELYKARVWDKPLKVERISPIEENKHARKVFAQYYHRTSGFWAKVKRRLTRHLGIKF